MFSAPRPAFLRAWLGLPGHIGLVAPDRHGDAASCGVIQDGWKVGPLFAPSEVTGERLFLGLAANAADDDRVYLDVPEPNASAVRLAERHGMTVDFEAARMVAGPPPGEPVERITRRSSLDDAQRRGGVMGRRARCR